MKLKNTVLVCLLFSVFIFLPLLGKGKQSEWGDCRSQGKSLLQIDYALPIDLEISKKDLSVSQKGVLLGTIDNTEFYEGPPGEGEVRLWPAKIWKLYNESKQVSITAHVAPYAKDKYHFYFYRGGDAFDSYTKERGFAHLSWGKWVQSRQYLVPNTIKFQCEFDKGFYAPKEVAEIILEKGDESGKKAGMTILDFKTRKVIAFASSDENNWYLTVYDAKKINIDVLIFTAISIRNL